jgi:hypothetical protein
VKFREGKRKNILSNNIMLSDNILLSDNMLCDNMMLSDKISNLQYINIFSKILLVNMLSENILTFFLFPENFTHSNHPRTMSDFYHYIFHLHVYMYLYSNNYFRSRYWCFMLLVSVSLFCFYSTYILLAEGPIAKYMEVKYLHLLIFRGKFTDSYEVSSQYYNIVMEIFARGEI